MTSYLLEHLQNIPWHYLCSTMHCCMSTNVLFLPHLTVDISFQWYILDCRDKLHFLSRQLVVEYFTFMCKWAMSHNMWPEIYVTMFPAYYAKASDITEVCPQILFLSHTIPVHYNIFWVTTWFKIYVVLELVLSFVCLTFSNTNTKGIQMRHLNVPWIVTNSTAHPLSCCI